MLTRSLPFPSRSRDRLRALACGLLACLWLSPIEQAVPPLRPPFEDGKASFVLRFGDEVIPYRVFGVSVLPEEEVDLAALAADQEQRFVLRAPAGQVRRRGENRWLWTAPEYPGLYMLEVIQPATVETITLNVFVMVPLSRAQGEINGYRIGHYPSTPLKGLEVYRPPDGLIEVTPFQADLPVSPHFKLGQFLCKQADSWPKYLVLDERLLRKLEVVLEKLNDAGIRTDGLHVMSGFRTPFYNLAIGNDTSYSIHQWGGAADVYVDESPKDGVMDDLDRNGRIDRGDALFLYDFVDVFEIEPWFQPFIGGLGIYNSTPAHGPYVHMDTRGFRARWGA